jgi:nitroimidazol reductase NimA-like FMN-containing flavoprotein (pyridoxamine 5'-phosphate oxidase superfamily)
VLARNRVARLGCFSRSDDRIYVIPISYTYRNGALYGISIEGQKVRYLREHPQGVCIEVDEVDDASNWVSVVATGTFQELKGEERRSEEAQALYGAANGPLRFALADDDIYREPETAVLWKIVISDLTGRSEKWDYDESFRYW